MSDTKPHTHQFVEVCIVLNGSIIHHINSEIQYLACGNVVCVRPGDIHYFSLQEKQTCELINFAVRLDTLLELSRYRGDDLFMQRFTESPLPPVFKESETFIEKIAKELLSINTMQITDPKLAKIKAKILLLNTFTKYFLIENSTKLLDESVPGWIRNMCSLLRQPANLSKGLTGLKDISPYSQQYLCKSFKKYLNKTPTEIINDFRFEEAARKLEGNEKISYIVEKLGIRSVSYFHKQFRKKYGITPAEYRKKGNFNNLIPC